jgi:hypothetical protein
MLPANYEQESLPANFALADCKDGSLIGGTVNGLTCFKYGTWKDIACRLVFRAGLSESASSPFLHFEGYRQLRMVTTDGGCRNGHFVRARRGLNPAIICKKVG